MSLLLENISFQYAPERPVFYGLNLEISSQGATVITGPSGCGKTTLLRLLAGLERPCSGTISGLNGVKLGMVFQEDRLLPWCSALENASICAVPNGPNPREVLEALGLADALHHPPSSLSGGMQRRVAIARALCYSPDLLLLDEPFTGLDDETKAVAARFCLRCCPWIIAVTHDLEEARLLNSRVIHLP